MHLCAPPLQLPLGRQCVEHYRLLHRYCVFSHDEMICRMASKAAVLDVVVASTVQKDMAVMVEDERALRDAVRKLVGFWVPAVSRGREASCAFRRHLKSLLCVVSCETVRVCRSLRNLQVFSISVFTPLKSSSLWHQAWALKSVFALGCLMVPAPSLEDIALAPVSGISSRVWRPFLDLVLVCLSALVLLPIPCGLGYWNFLISPEMRSGVSPAPLFLSQVVLAILVPPFPRKRSHWFLSGLRGLVWDCSACVGSWGENRYLHNIDSSNPRTSNSIDPSPCPLHTCRSS